jgi:hypothetical protein
MEVTAVVLHRGALAHYSVHSDGEEHYEAHLVRYKGAPEHEPPQDIEFSKEGRHCTGSTEEQDLMDDICNAVQVTMRRGGSGMSAL